MRRWFVTLLLTFLVGCSSVPKPLASVALLLCEDPVSDWPAPDGYRLLYSTTDVVSIWLLYELSRKEELEWPSRTITRLDVYEPTTYGGETIVLTITVDGCIYGIYKLDPDLRYLLGQLA